VQRIHGLVIDAGVALPGLASAGAHAEPDVVLELRERLAVPAAMRIRYRAGSPSAALESRVEIADDAHGCTTFRYGDGSAADVDLRGRPVRIRAAIAPGQTLEDLCAYLYGPVLGFVLRATGRLALHASCVRAGDGAVLLAGPPGAGKSTTAAALAARGATVLSDDLTALDRHGDGAFAWPAFDHLRLWPDGARVVLGDDRLARITPGWEKRRFPLEGDAFAAEPAPVRAVLVLAPRQTGRDVRVDAIPPGRAVVALAALTYANYLLDAPMRARELEQLGALVRAVPVHALAPAAGRDRLDALCDAIARAAGAPLPVGAGA
jgi:hypothetical protein